MFTGCSNQTWAGGVLPFSLGGIGAPGCSLLVGTDAVEGSVTNGGGVASRSDSIPNLPALVGAKLFHPWLVVDPGAGNLGMVPSDALETTIGGGTLAGAACERRAQLPVSEVRSAGST
ncbi:MAG: hypothetical protein IPM29_19915 [Planctomycetes bacterium]|nr:hypothetical protein [Planctomycetota bacterium]